MVARESCWRHNTPQRAKGGKMDSKITYRKIGGGSLRLYSPDGKLEKIIKPNETFTAYAADIPPTFKKYLVRISGGEEEIVQQYEPDEVRIPLFEIVKKPYGWCDIINTQNGKKVNERALRLEEAEEALRQLMP